MTMFLRFCVTIIVSLCMLTMNVTFTVTLYILKMSLYDIYNDCDTMTLCDLYNDILWQHNHFCGLMPLCA